MNKKDNSKQDNPTLTKRLLALAPAMQAWLDGKPIQYRQTVTILGTKTTWAGWSAIYEPYWHDESFEFRVKPELVEVWTNVYATGFGGTYHSRASALNAVRCIDGYIKTVHLVEVEEP